MFGKKELEEKIDKLRVEKNRLLEFIRANAIKTRKLENKFNELLELLGVEEEKCIGKEEVYNTFTLDRSNGSIEYSTRDIIKTRLVKKETPMGEKETSTGKAPKENKKRTKAERLAYSRGFHAGQRSKTK